MSKDKEATRLTRRSLLGALGAGMVAVPAGAAARSAGARAPRALSRDLQRAGVDDWQALVGQRFSLAADMGAPLTLLAVEPLGTGGRGPSRNARGQGFAALFESTGSRAPAGDETYWMAPRSGAPLPLYLGERAVVAGRARFLAVFG